MNAYFVIFKKNCIIFTDTKGKNTYYRTNILQHHISRIIIAALIIQSH